MSNTKIYFPNLNGVRFIAAILVVIHHIEQIKFMYGFENNWHLPFIEVIGKLGVVLFFVLSGFLITYLLLVEETKFNRIDVSRFYLRRILRIWPLYFFIVILAFFVLPNIEIFERPNFGKDVIYQQLSGKLLLYFLFFSNLALSVFGITPFVSHTWSIGTEEQFYLIWPLVLRFVKRNRLLLMILIIALYLLVHFFLQSSISNQVPFRNVFRGFWKLFNIDCMAIGGLFAVLHFQKNKLVFFLKKPFIFFPILIVTIVFISFGIHFPWLHYEMYALLFGIIILNLATSRPTFLESSPLNYLGNISYGIYMYHPIAIVLALSFCKLIFEGPNGWMYPISIGLAIGFSALSYRYLESYFLKFKSKFTLIHSGK